MVTAVVRKGQHKLKQQFEYNKKMLKLDSTDHRLVQQVYDLKPNTQQIRCIRNIWKAIQNKKQMEEQIEILKHCIHSNCLSPAFNLLDYTLDKIDKILTRSKPSSTNDNDNKQQTILNALRLKKIGGFKYDMLELSLKLIPPCQSHFYYTQPMEEIIEQENKRLYAENCKNLTNYTFLTNDAHATKFFSEVKHLLEQLYTKSLPKKLKGNARYIYKMIKSMKEKLRKANIAVGQTDKSKFFFFIDAQEYEEKIRNYMSKTNAYQEIISGICPLADDLHSVLILLDYLLKHNRITKEQYKQMYPNLKTLELAHIYFNLKVHKPEMSVRSILASINAPARQISSFLDQLITPIYNYVTKDVTFINSIDLIRKLNEYQQQDYLTSTTLFVIFDVTDLYTMIPRDGAIAALTRFCEKYPRQAILAQDSGPDFVGIR
ncbi:unnamed protein product [Rotaria sordida]|uniref:Reverse transcriptase domain-containing protein n=1 Tax=Rotaria sordida TaxID=392033 RepID=A0A819U9G6_9BILA|nr:unnamed protein product [Rotaria sordida]CAF4088264.1 unnamed protein product [Rotaria sordida]